MVNIDKIQQHRIKRFYKLEAKSHPEHAMIVVVVCIMYFLGTIFLLLPYNYIISSGNKPYAIMSMIYMLSSFCIHDKRYRSYSNNINGHKNNENLYNILKYLPVDNRQINIYCMEKTFIPIFILSLIIGVVRNSAALLVYKDINIWDTIIPLIIGLFFPIVYNVINEIIRERFTL